MKKQKPKIKDKKLRGEWAEMRFMVRAAEHGLPVSKPWGEMRTFDFVVGRPSRFVSVQVKSTARLVGDRYDCSVRGGHRAYPRGSFDFLAAYAVQADVWYIIPEKIIWGKCSVALTPPSENDPYEEYKEAWHLLREASTSNTTISIQACAEEDWPKYENKSCNGLRQVDADSPR